MQGLKNTTVFHKHVDIPLQNTPSGTYHVHINRNRSGLVTKPLVEEEIEIEELADEEAPEITHFNWLLKMRA